VTDLLISIAHSPWAYLVLATVLVIDGFFPFVPGETAVVSLSSIVATAGGHDLWIVLLVAVIATMAGDAISFFVGRRLGVPRWRWMSGARLSAARSWATTRFLQRPGAILIGAKFIPFARVVITMVGGASGLTVARYLPRSFVAAVIYTTYHVAVGALAGAWFASNPLLAVALSVATVIVIAAAIDRIVKVRSGLVRER
jgi:membrane-associated protein